MIYDTYPNPSETGFGSLEEVSMEGETKDWHTRWFEWIEKFLNNQRFPSYVLPVVLTVAISILVYSTGGLKYVYSHAMYIPIILCAFTNGLKGGISLGLLGGLLLGPFMPLVVATGEAQETLQWLYRTGFFVLIGTLAGIEFDMTRFQLNRSSWVATHDTRTGFPNRHALFESLRANPQKSNSPTPTALAIVSFGNANTIRSSFSPVVLDEAIAQLWSRIEETIETGIRLFHVKSNEIGVLFFDKARPEIESDLDSLMMKAKLPYLTKGSNFYGDILITATEITQLYDDPRLYLQECEVTLHKAENEPIELGGYFDHTDITPERETLGLLGELEEAIKSSTGLHLYFQPKVDIKTLALVGAEALLRWEHPRLGSIPPGQFIPSAEKTTLINPLTDWVLENTLLQIVQWQKKGMNLPVAVNVSIRNFHQRDFVATIARALDKHQVDPGLLELEVTENVLMYDAENTIVRLNKLHELGIEISIDDYGTGFSSLKYMFQIPASLIKIDTFFVQAISSGEDAKTLVQSIISTAHGMRKNVIAEGIEDKTTFDMLAEMGCNQAQGYFISPPLPAEEFFTWAEEWEKRTVS